jgi:hypothetical protein
MCLVSVKHYVRRVASSHEKAKVREICERCFLLAGIESEVQWELHVRLSRAKEDVTTADVASRDVWAGLSAYYDGHIGVPTGTHLDLKHTSCRVSDCGNLLAAKV